MLKAPVPGQVKTRIAAALGAERACEIYRLMVERVFAEIPTAWPVEVHGAPPEKLGLLAEWLGGRAKYRAQCSGDLGARLIHSSEAAFVAGAESVVLLGGDCPWQTRTFFHASESALHTHDVVIGPARDGGYTLIAMKTLHRELFENIAWSSASVLHETLDRARSLGLRVALLDVLDDVDDAPTWQAARVDLFPEIPEDRPDISFKSTDHLAHS